MLATLNIITNPFHPNLGKVQKPLVRRTKVNTLVNKHRIDLNKPVICYYNGTALLRKDWGKTLVKDNDVVSFVYLPQGGGGSNPLRMVLMIAVMVIAPQVGLAMAGGVAGTMATIYTAAIGFLGTALINALIPPPELPKGQQASQMASASPTYSINAQGNQARIGEAIPVLYGKMKIFPDFAAQPYVEYESNDQYLYQLFLITQGKAVINPAEIFIEDSPISSFDVGDYDYEIVQPGSKPTLFPTAVFNTAEVNGQELTGRAGAYSFGPFSVNPPLTSINKLSLDIVFPRGMYFVNDEGAYTNMSVSFSLFAQKIDDTGATVGGAFLLGSHTVSGSTPTAIRRTYSYPVPAGRYAVIVSRDSPKSENGRYANDMVWAGARGYSSEQIDYGDATLLVLKLKANNNVSQQSSRKVNVIAQRQLAIPSYNAADDAFDFSAPTSTSSIAWAIVDICRAAYGAGVSTARFNVSQLIELNSLWESRGDKLNCIFDSTQTFWEALTMACRAGRVRPYVQGGMIHFVRDSLQTLPTALFTSRNIVKGSFKITYMMPSEDSADCIDVEYFDNVLWKPRIVRASLDGSTSAKPVKVKAFGITDRAHAFREGMYMAGGNRYRRKEISFETELEGHIPSLGDLIAIQSDIPEWGQSGEVESFAPGMLVSNEPFEWTDGAVHYMVLRRKDGSGTPPIEVAKGATPSTLLFDQSDIDFDIYDGFEKERTHIAFGRSGQVVQLARVMTTVPRTNTVQITAINEDARVHAADGTTVPLDVHEWAIPTPKVKPILADFTIVQTGSGTTPSISISWQPTPGASKYVIQKSTDGTNWETVGEVALGSFSFLSNTGLLYVRVAAFGGVLGPYVTKSINVGEVAPPPNVTIGSINASGQTFEANWSPIVDCDGYNVQVIQAGSTKREIVTTATSFSYSLENAISDGGPWREIQVSIRAKKGQVMSAVPLVLNGINAAPEAPSLLIVAGMKAVSITVSRSNEIDYAGTVIHASEESGFVPDAGNKIYEGTGNFFIHTDVTKQTYYKAAHFDTYGKSGLNFSTQYNALPITSTGGIEVADTLPTTGNFEGRVVYLTTDDTLYTYDEDTGTWKSGSGIPDGSITYEKLAAGLNFFAEIQAGEVTADHIAANAIDASKIQANTITANKLNVANLSAINANMGNLTSGTITLDMTGHIKGGQTAYNTGNGFFMGYDENAYKFSIGSSYQGLTWSGTELNVTGKIYATDGEFGGSLTGANGTFTGELVAATGSFGGQLLAGTLDFAALDGVRLNYMTPGTYEITVPAGKTTMRITICGGSGGGGGGAGGIGSGGMGGGGGGGGSAKPSVVTIENLVAGSTYTLIIGAKGLGGGYSGYTSGGSGSAGGNSQVVGLVVAPGGGGGGGGPGNGGGGGGVGGNGGANGSGGGGVQQIPRTDYPGNYNYAGGYGGAGGTDVAGRTGGKGGNGYGTPTGGQVGSAGQDGFALIEFFNPNSVVLQTTYSTLIAALQRQGIQTV